MKRFYRVCNAKNEGLWYCSDGTHTGLIHNKFNNLTNSSLEMPFDEEIVGYLSVADSLEDLYNWFSKDDILQLQQFGYRIMVFESDDFKFYERFSHNVIRKETAVLTDILFLEF